MLDTRRVAEEELRREERLYGPFSSFHSSFFCFELSNLLSLRQSQETKPGGTVNKLLLFFLVHVKKRGRKKTVDIGEVTTTGTGARNKDGTLVRQATTKLEPESKQGWYIGRAGYVFGRNRNRNKDGTLVRQATYSDGTGIETRMVHWSGRLRIWTVSFFLYLLCVFAVNFSLVLYRNRNRNKDGTLVRILRNEKRSWIQVFGRVRRSDAGVNLKACATLKFQDKVMLFTSLS
ncbi:hypothetical protein Agabi119p4_6583 [Agaricus bisporus var. burnettii]|uniref:Uncharacterized protein n=1 Tax=Agaricus bisporus var. burnettii TaxID=192524 RepID=A0A8H7C8W5_AGABI|nr:hypothetical protein Agabi119p4_6583 [Agaricus bisporus var. burnettii]